MRRLASVLGASSKRTDTPDAPTSSPGLAHKKSRVLLSLSRKYSTAPSLPPLVASDLVNSSSSSSSGSTTIHTPDDDGLPRTPSKKGSWKSWLGGKNADTSDNLEEHQPPPWQSSQNDLRPPKHGVNETDAVSLHSDGPYVIPDRALSLSPQQLAAARANTRTMIMNSLVHDPTSPPLYKAPDGLSFPRSCHNSQRLRRRETLQSEMHKKTLLARLDRLSSSDESSLVQFASKSILSRPQSHRSFQDDFFPPAEFAGLHSSGLENWVSRPCFEDRLQLWTRLDSGEIIRSRIPGSHLGVAALEFSSALELLAGTLPECDEVVEVDNTFDPTSEFALPPLTLNLDPPATQVIESELEPLSVPSPSSRSKGSPAKPSSPQPVTTPALSHNVPSHTRQLGEPTPSGSASTNDPAPKRGVRFADDDGKDDQIPLGYVLRIRKNKEQKAQFLREERQRRERAAQLSMEDRRATAPPQENRVSRVVVTPRRPPPRPLVSLNEPPKLSQQPSISHVVREEDHLRREVEKIEMEKLRRSRELARKQAEERERSFAEELQATRARREASRAGRPLDSVPISSRDHSMSQDSMHASLRRSSFNKHTPDLVFTPVSPYEGSPSSSVPATPGSQYSLSRPPSVYSSHTASSEDVRGRDSRNASRRMSVVSDSAKGVSLLPPYDPRASFNPYAWNVTSVPAIPPVPPMPAIPMVNGMPFYGMEMPLLPPTPPFMVNQFGPRSRSYTGMAGHQSPLQSSAPLPRNNSSEGINSSSRNSSPHSSGSHQRRSSEDAFRREKALGNPRPHSELRASKTSVAMRGVPSPSGAQRSSWLPPEQTPTKKMSSLRPVSSSYASGAPSYARRQTAAS